MPNPFFHPQHRTLSRRAMLQAGTISLLGLGMNHLVPLRAAVPAEEKRRVPRAKSVIYIFLSGGLAQHESFDLKPDAPLEIRGEFKPIPTRTPGVQICEHLPGLANRSHLWALCRSLTHGSNDHSAGHHIMLTGRSELPTGFDPSQPKATDWPSISALTNSLLSPKNNLPPAIVLPERLVHRTGRVIPGQFAGLLGARRDPWFLDASPYNPENYGAYPEFLFHHREGRKAQDNLMFRAPNLSLPAGLGHDRLRSRVTLVDELNRQRDFLEHAGEVESFDRYWQMAVSLLTQQKTVDAFDVTHADPKLQEKYGRNSFGWSLLLAARPGESANGPKPYPVGGDGYVVADNAYGLLTIRQLTGGKIAFSLTTTNDTGGGLATTPKANFQGLSMNGLNGTALTNTVNFGQVPSQFLSLDPTEWNEFWIVLRKDDSGLGTHTAHIYTNGAPSAQVFHLTAAASAGDYAAISYVTLGMSQTAQMGAVDVDFLAYKFEAVFPPGSIELVPPTISDVTPASSPQGILFYPAKNGISFNVKSAGSKTIAASGVKLVLNGVDVSSKLSVTGSSASRAITYNALADNTAYAGQISVTDSGGQVATFPLVFDTFTETSALIIEAEDYNHSRGQFTDKPAPNQFAPLVGAGEIDFHDVTPASAGAYRADAVDTVASNDTARQKYLDAGATDYDVGLVEQGEWLNYTRTFAAGKYEAYLRSASSVAQQVRFDLVTGDRTKTAQTTSLLGTFPISGGGNVHTYSRLSDAFGNPISVNLSGVQTLRLTMPDASINLLMNYLVFAPAGAAVAPPLVAFASPAPNSINLLPDDLEQIVILNGDKSVALGSVKLSFDGKDVTSAATIASIATGVSILFRPASDLALSSTHTNALTFSDTSAPAQTFTNQWTFKVANLPVLKAAWASAPGSGRTNGFNIKIHKARNSAQGLLFPNIASRAELQVADRLNDADTGKPYVNEAAGPNGDGLYAETKVINYSQDGTDRGAFPGDQPFPHLSPADVPDPNHFAMAVTAYLELSAGLHRFGVRRDDGFKLTSGPSFAAADATLALGAFEPDGESGTATTEFDFVVEADGVYPFRLIWFENTGGADVEWYSVNRTSGAATLINDPGKPDSVKAYMSRVSAPSVTLQILNPRVSGGNLEFSFGTTAGRQYLIESKTSLSDASWQSQPAISGDGSAKNFSAPVSGAATRFFRVRVQ